MNGRDISCKGEAEHGPKLDCSERKKKKKKKGLPGVRKPRSIMVKFTRRNTRNKIIRERKKLKGTHIGIQELLTTVEWVGFKLTFLEKDICHDHEIDILRSLAKLN